MFILSAKSGLVNTDRMTRIYLKAEKGGCPSIIASCGMYEDDGREKMIILEIFDVDELNVARDVFEQLTFSMGGEQNSKIINLADISKRAKYEYQTGKQYTDEEGRQRA